MTMSPDPIDHLYTIMRQPHPVELVVEHKKGGGKITAQAVVCTG